MIRRRNRAAVAVLACVLLWIPPPARGDASGLFNWLFSDLNLVSVEQEAEISRELARDVESKQPIVRDREIEEYVSDLGERLVAVLRRPDFRYRFLVVGDRTVNAFGIGGGHIYANAGLLAAADTEGQVAAVLAHEIGHQARRHVAKQMSRQAVFEGLARVAVGPHASQWINLATGLGVTSGQLYFGREAEREADSVMVDLLPRAGYDPREALAIFAKLRAIEGRDPGAVATLLSSHPPTRERIEMIEQAIARQHLPSNLIRDSRRFQEVHHRVLSEVSAR
jgi:beta-barrel assembly-enhancing protease